MAESVPSEPAGSSAFPKTKMWWGSRKSQGLDGHGSKDMQVNVVLMVGPLQQETCGLHCNIKPERKPGDLKFRQRDSLEE